MEERALLGGPEARGGGGRSAARKRQKWTQGGLSSVAFGREDRGTMGSSEYLMKVQNLSNVDTAGISQPQTLAQKLRYELEAQQVILSLASLGIVSFSPTPNTSEPLVLVSSRTPGPRTRRMSCTRCRKSSGTCTLRSRVRKIEGLKLIRRTGIVPAPDC